MQEPKDLQVSSESGLINMNDRTPGARLLLGMAIGDAFGARFENLKRGKIQLIDQAGVYQGKNKYTDDTQMAIGIAELLISGSPFTEENIADALLKAYRRDPRQGYSELTRRMLEEAEHGETFLHFLTDEELKGRKSDGAAMRALPLGMLADREAVIRSATKSAAITHGHPDALAATVGIALISHERYHHKTSFPDIVRNLPKIIPNLTREGRVYLERVISGEYSPYTILGESASYGVPYTESLILFGAVIAILTKFGESPGEALLRSVELGGDTDTTASIVLGAAMIHPGAGTLPLTLVKDLENEEYGRDYLTTLGDELTRRFPVISS